MDPIIDETSSTGLDRYPKPTPTGTMIPNNGKEVDIRSHSEIMGHSLGHVDPQKPHLTLHRGPR